MNRNALFVMLFMVVGLASVGCQSSASQQAGTLTHAVAVVWPTKGHTAEGVVRFTQTAHGVNVVADIKGLRANGKHGFHIHEFGDVSAIDGMATGSHYNPGGHAHALTDKAHRHAGDMGNLDADQNGVAHLEILLHGVTINGLMNPILGRAVIVHVKEDDGSQPVGNAGARIGQGTIGVMKAPAPADKPADKK